jgi:hypothetical protein
VKLITASWSFSKVTVWPSWVCWVAVPLVTRVVTDVIAVCAARRPASSAHASAAAARRPAKLEEIAGYVLMAAEVDGPGGQTRP